MAKILIVDDIATNRQYLVTLLGYMKHRLLEAADGEAALKIARSEHPDLVISDIFMPKMDGFKFAEQVRADATIAATPVIFMTATYREPQARQLAAACGVTIVLPKPCDPHAIIMAVNGALGLKDDLVPETLPKASTDNLVSRELRRIDEKFSSYADELRTVKKTVDKVFDRTTEMFTEYSSEISARFANNVVSLQRLGARMTALVEIIFNVSPEEGPAHVIETIFNGARKIMPAGFAAIGLYEPVTRDLKYVFASGVPTEIYEGKAQDSDGLPEAFAKNEGARRIVSPDKFIEGFPAGHPGVCEVLGTAIAHRGRVHGWIYFANEVAGGVTDEDERILATLAVEIAVFYENAMLHDTMQRYAADLQVEVVKRTRAEGEARERDRQLAQAQKLEAVGQLTGGIAHDFNNLLTVIRGSAEDLYEDMADAPAVQEQISLVLQAAGRGADLVRQLLTIARKQALKPEIIEVKTLIEPLAKMLRRTLQENIAIKVQIAEDLPPIYVDPGSLENVILNLAVNARDAMPDGGTLSIEASKAILDAEYAVLNPDVHPGAYVLIAIGDTGTGMPKDVIERAFEPFFTTKEAGKGTGLGLSMVFGFVKQSGGHAKIYSELGYGTTIKIYLPITSVATSIEGTTMAETAAAPGKASGHILLVEDDELVRMSVGNKLIRLGYTVTTAAAPSEAIAILEASPRFDLVFTDILMPGDMTGADLARVIQERWPKTKILTTSGYTETTMLGKVKIPPGVRLLSKPYSNADFARTLREVLAE